MFDLTYNVTMGDPWSQQLQLKAAEVSLERHDFISSISLKTLSMKLPRSRYVLSATRGSRKTLDFTWSHGLKGSLIGPIFKSRPCACGLKSSMKEATMATSDGVKVVELPRFDSISVADAVSKM